MNDYYQRSEESLRHGDPAHADEIIQSAEKKYGSKSELLYEMDRGMTLHLAGRYESSNALLEKADQTVETLYTRKVRTETKAFLINDTELPYEGDAYEQVMINVIKALNYAAEDNWSDAMVEVRRIDARLNVVADRSGAKDGYRNDGFARYVSGVFYEATGDINNAFIAYRNAYEAYKQMRSWSKTPVPPSLPTDLLRTSEALHFTEEHEEYRRTFPDVKWKPISETKDLAQLIVLSYNGRAPYKEDMFIDLPVSLQALNLVLLNRGLSPGNHSQQRVQDSAIYGLSGRVVRVALPRLVPQKTAVAHTEVTLSREGGPYRAESELVDNVTAVAEKTLSDRFATLSLKAVARAAVKYGLAEGAGYGARAAVGNNSDLGPWIGLLVRGLAHALAIYSEEADKRSWRTLPDEIHMTRLWVPPGTYHATIRPVGRGGAGVQEQMTRNITLKGGESSLVIQRVVQ